jgi:hypothetical protein
VQYTLSRFAHGHQTYEHFQIKKFTEESYIAMATGMGPDVNTLAILRFPTAISEWMTLWSTPMLCKTT